MAAFVTVADEQLAQRVLEMVDNGDDLARVRTAQGHTALHAAAFLVDCEFLDVVVARGVGVRSLVDVPDADGHTPLLMAAKLGFVEGVRALLALGADTRAVSKDVFGLKVSGFPLPPMCGGKTALHLAALDNSEDAGLCVEAILAHDRRHQPPHDRPAVALEDALGHTPVDIALHHGNEHALRHLAPELLPLSDKARTQGRRDRAAAERLCRERESASAAVLPRMPYELMQYRPKHPHLFEQDLLRRSPQSVFRPEVVDALGLAVVGKRGREGGPGGGQDALLRALARRLGSGVYALDVFAPAFCSQLLEEAEWFDAAARAQGRGLTRPNTMNQSGVVMAEMGLGPLLNDITSRVLNPLANAVLLHREAEAEGEEGGGRKSAREHENEKEGRSGGGGEEEGDEGKEGKEEEVKGWAFQSQHSFLVKYSQGEDTDLKTHADDSDVTFNLCLGKQFSGADLYFHARSHACVVRGKEGKEERKGEGKDDPFEYPHPSDCPHCTLRYTHKVGTCVVHVGALVHGVDALRDGQRCNLVVWCRERRGLAGQNLHTPQ